MPTPRARAYLAGPMFSLGDKYEQMELDRALSKKYEVHLTQRDGIGVASVMALLNNPTLDGRTMIETPIVDRMVAWVTRIIVALDVYQSVEGCQCVVVNLDGRVSDEGGLVEATLAWSAGLPVVPFKTTPITELGLNNNPMVDAICGWVPPWSTPGDVVTAVDAALCAPSGVDLGRLAPTIQLLSQLGRTIRKIRRRRTWTALDVERATAELQALPAAARNLIEDIRLLQPSALQVVVPGIEFSRLKTGDPRQQAIVLQLIKDAKQWSGQRGVRRAIVARPVTV